MPRPLDLRQLFKLRLVVAAMGETRAGFRVAQLACDEALDVGL